MQHLGDAGDVQVTSRLSARNAGSIYCSSVTASVAGPFMDLMQHPVGVGEWFVVIVNVRGNPSKLSV